ncbi:MAG: DUF72 domain-containing protein [Nitrososphaerales archaeon]
MLKIGTSGYNYYWNEGKPTPFLWYVNQGFKTVEINASFYRFPTLSWIKVWEKAPEDFDFSIKVHRSITHYLKLRGKAFELWERFSSIFEPIKDKISFWLFQLSSNFKYSDKNLEALKEFIAKTSIKEKFVIEFRESKWWEHVDDVKKLNIIFCSVDSPELPLDILSCKDIIYMRLHGRSHWYSHLYTYKELKDITQRIKKLNPSKVYIYLNNNHGMLPNAFTLMKLFGSKKNRRN